MALRVLLADESSTIKKVMQLALQDFGIEVKAVPNGIDVISVAESFNPDIFFVDILLAKKTGYDVCQELKNNNKFNRTPVVLMWSGFMEIDEKKAQQARPDARLEKPFDGETLRELVQRLVVKTSSNPVSEFIITPKLPDFEEAKSTHSPTPHSKDDTTQTDPVGAKILDALKSKSAPKLDDEKQHDAIELDDQDDFKQVPLPPIDTAAKSPKVYTPPPPPKNDFEITQSFTPQQASEENLDFSKFKINVNPNTLEDNTTAIGLEDDDNQFVIVSDLEDFDPENSLNSQQTFTQSKITEPKIEEIKTASSNKAIKSETKAQKDAPSAAHTAPTPIAPPTVDPEMVEMMVREQVRTVIEQVVWKVLPEITEKVIREEINKLLKESEKKFQAKL